MTGYAAGSDARLPDHLAALLQDLAHLLGTRRLRLFGGAAFDLVTGRTEVHDLDVALPGSLEMRAACLNRLRAHPEVSAVSAERQYWIRFCVPVTIVTVRWRGTLLDLNFLDRWGSIGHFDVEQVYWEFQGPSLVDPCGVTGGPVRTIRLVTGVERENPILLLNRLLTLSAKYAVPFWRDVAMRPIVEQIVSRTRRWAPDHWFHGCGAHDAFVRTLPAATRRSSTPEIFLSGCVESGVVESRLSALASGLTHDPGAIRKLAATGSDADFWSVADAIVEYPGDSWRDYQGGAG